MRKLLLAFGMILLLVGIIFTSSAVQSKKTMSEEEEFVNGEIDSWQISSNFIQGDKLKLVVAPGEEWDRYVEPPVDGVPFNHKFVYVNISDPNGKDSGFEVAYVKYQGNFSIYHVKVLSSNGFDAQNISQGIVGEIRDTGLYTATVRGFLPPGGGPPSALKFFKLKKRVLIKYPYSYLLYPGAAILFAGITLSIFAACAHTVSKRVQRKRRRRAKFRYSKGLLTAKRNYSC